MKNYQEFKEEVQKAADACGLSEEELQAVYHHIKYCGGKISKEESIRITKILAKPEADNIKQAGINGVKAGESLRSILLKMKGK